MRGVFLALLLGLAPGAATALSPPPVLCEEPGGSVFHWGQRLQGGLILARASDGGGGDRQVALVSCSGRVALRTLTPEPERLALAERTIVEMVASATRYSFDDFGRRLADRAVPNVVSRLRSGPCLCDVPEDFLD